MSSPVEAEEQDLQNDAATIGQRVATPSAAMQQSEEAVLDAEEEQSAADEASSLSPAAAADASTAQTIHQTLPDKTEHDSPEPPGLAEDSALQPSSADAAEDAAASDAETGSAVTDLDVQEGYYPDQDARPIWSSSLPETSNTPADIDDRQDSQQQEDLEDRPSSSSNVVNSNVASALQPSGASAAIQAALSNPELHPDHPLLQRAQKTLEKQLLATKYRLESEVREKSIALQHARTKREAIGVELYNFQQQLAKMQMQLEKAQENYSHISQVRVQAEEQLQKLQQTHAEEEQLTAQERLKVEKVQAELDGLAATLKQVELYNEQMKGEIAVTRRATYAAEQSVQRLEKGKKDQDLLIDHLHQQVRTQEQQIAIYTQQFENQQRETRAAREMLAEAQAEMEGVHFEKKQLTAQWQSSLIATQRRDEALRALEDAITEQHEQERSIENEIHAYRKDIVREQIRNEQLTAVMRKLEGESGFLQTQNDSAVKKQEKLQETYASLQHELSLAEEKLRKAQQQGKLVEGERKVLDKGIAKANNSIKAVEAKVLDNLSEQTTAEKSATKTAADIKQMRKQVYDEEMFVVQLQNELAKLEVDILHTQSHSLRLEQTLKLLEQDITEKMQTISKYEVDLKRRADEIEKKTKEVDLLNRKYEKIVAGQQGGPETGPLEAVVNNLTREIQGKGEEGRDLQRRWVGWQTELVQLQQENNRLAQDLQRLKAHHTITNHKRTRLRHQHDVVQREVKGLEKGIAHLHNCMARYNALIADSAMRKVQLVNDNFHLETKIGHELKDLEEEADRLQAHIESGHKDKSQLLTDIVDTEKQVMLWQRKIELEREMNDVLDPTVGGDVVGAMKREIHRMQLRAAELGRIQESLLLDLERSIAKRDTITLKGQAAVMKKIPDITDQALKKALGEMERSIRNTKRESRATDERISIMEVQRAQLTEEMSAAHDRVGELQQQEGEVRQAMETNGSDKIKALFLTSSQQKVAKSYEDVAAGRYKIKAAQSVVDVELQAAADQQQQIVMSVRASMQHMPELQPALERILLRSLAAA